jgi:hypothetical protein
MAVLLTLFICSGLLLSALSVPLILGKIAPNPLYGFRVKKTLEDPSVWYPVNAYAAKRLLAISTSAVVLFFVPGIGLDSYALACAGVALAGLIVSLIQSFVYLRSFPSGPDR